MSCRRYERLIALHVGGDLKPTAGRRVEGHLTECAACREYAAALKVSQASLKGLAGVAAPGSVPEAIRQAVAREAERRSTGTLRTRPAWALGLVGAAALVLVVAMGSAWLSSQEARETPGMDALAHHTPEGPTHDSIVEPEARSGQPVAPEQIDSGQALRLADFADEDESTAVELAEAAATATPEPPTPSVRASSQTVIRLVTDDPNIIILLVTGNEEKEMHNGSEA